jgi:hypothetical protein
METKLDTKSILHVIIGIVVIVALLSFRDVAVEFIKSTKEEPVSMEQMMQMLMGPSGGSGHPSNMEQNKFGGKDFAGK